jgi:hypothetical protein
MLRAKHSRVIAGFARFAALAGVAAGCQWFAGLGDQRLLELDSGADAGTPPYEAGSRLDVADRGDSPTDDGGADGRADAADSGDAPGALDGAVAADVAEPQRPVDAADEMESGEAAGSDASDSSDAAEEGPFTSFFYDGITQVTQCAFNDTSMHCCPRNTVMVGALPYPNVFKCAVLAPDRQNGQIIFDTGTDCGGIHCCPTGMVMIGLHIDLNVLMCQAVPGLSPVDTVDGNPPTEDGYPMHVCPGWQGKGPSDTAMGGLQVNEDLFVCRD